MGGVERNKFCTDGRMAFGGKKIAAGLQGDTFFFLIANLSGHTSAAGWAALLCLPRQRRAALQQVAASCSLRQTSA